MATISAEQLLVVTGIATAVAALPRGAWTLRGALAAAGLALAAWGVQRHHLVPILVGGTLAFINLAHFGLGWSLRRGNVRFTAEEEGCRVRCFAQMPPAAVRQLFDQGLWINGKAGETLMREGDRVARLLYLSEGEVRITARGHEIARSGIGHFFGELDILSHTPAIVSITLATPGRFWCIEAAALERLIAENPRFGPAFEAAMASELREKLRERSLQVAQALAG